MERHGQLGQREVPGMLRSACPAHQDSLRLSPALASQSHLATR